MSAPFRIRKKEVSTQLAAETSAERLKPYLDRLLKMIPAEVIGLYLVGSGVIPTDSGGVLTIWAGVCLAGVILIRTYGTADSAVNESPQWASVVISSVAFLIWVYALGGPFVRFGLHVPFIGSLFVLAWTFFVPIFYKG